jgi:hypothetical protein
LAKKTQVKMLNNEAKLNLVETGEASSPSSLSLKNLIQESRAFGIEFVTKTIEKSKKVRSSLQNISQDSL